MDATGRCAPRNRRTGSRASRKVPAFGEYPAAGHFKAGVGGTFEIEISIKTASARLTD